MPTERVSSLRARRAVAVAGVLGLSLLSCGREPTGPGAGLRLATGLSFIAEFPGPLASIASGAGSVVPFDRVRVVFHRMDNAVALDSLVPFPSNADSVALSLSVPLSSSAPSTGEPMTLSLAYVNASGDTVFRGGPVPVVAQVRAAGSPPPEPASVPLAYVGPGASATQVTVSTDTISLVAGDPFTVTAVARDAQGAPLAGTPLLFSSLDGTRATLTSPAAGAGVTTSLRGTSRIRVQLLTGAAEDTATIIAAFLRIRAGQVSALPRDAASRGRAFPTPRTWDYTARLLAATEGEPPRVRQLLVHGTVGDAVGHELLTWLDSLELPDPEALLADPAAGRLDGMRADRVHAALQGVLAAVVGRPTPERWTAAMEVCVAACRHGGIDPAVPVVRALLRMRPAGAELPSGIAVFAAPLALAGLLPR